MFPVTAENQLIEADLQHATQFNERLSVRPRSTRFMFIPGLRNDSDYRSNVGFVNGSTEAEVVNVKLLSATGSTIAQTTLTVAPNAQVQYAATALFPGLNASGFTLNVEGDANAKVFAYGSMVDNKSGDPVFFAGR